MKQNHFVFMFALSLLICLYFFIFSLSLSLNLYLQSFILYVNLNCKIEMPFTLSSPGVFQPFCEQ